LRVQQQNRVVASTNRAQFVAENRGRPQTVVMAKPLPVERRQPVQLGTVQQRPLPRPVNQPELHPGQGTRPQPPARVAQQVPQPRPTVQAPPQPMRPTQPERPVQQVRPAPQERPAPQVRSSPEPRPAPPAQQPHPVQQPRPVPEQRPMPQARPEPPRPQEQRQEAPRPEQRPEQHPEPR
jgi:hypothetical protein